MQIITDIKQGSPEWRQLRLGVITGSKFKDVLAEGKGKTRASYMRKLAAEILTGETEESFQSEYMDWGTATEPQARAMYELKTGNIVSEVAFIKHDSQNIGVSPDGIIMPDIRDYEEKMDLVEFKCPKSTTQIETYLSGKMPTCHIPQVQGQMWVAGADWCDFVSFDPRINGAAGWFYTRVDRDDAYIKMLQEKVFKFEDELNKLIKTLKG